MDDRLIRSIIHAIKIKKYFDRNNIFGLSINNNIQARLIGLMRA